MSIYLIEKPSGKVGYYSFRRLLKEEKIEEICKKTGEEVPKKDDLPVTIGYKQIRISEIEIDTRA